MIKTNPAAVPYLKLTEPISDARKHRPSHHAKPAQADWSYPNNLNTSYLSLITRACVLRSLGTVTIVNSS